MPLELTEDEERALIALLRQTIDDARYPLAPRLDPLKAILAKLEPPPPRPQPLPPLTPGIGAEPRTRPQAAMTIKHTGIH